MSVEEEAVKEIRNAKWLLNEAIRKAAGWNLTVTAEVSNSNPKVPYVEVKVTKTHQLL